MIKRRVKGRTAYCAVLDRIEYFSGHSAFWAVLQEAVPNERGLRNGTIVRFGLKAWRGANVPRKGMCIRLKRLVLFGYGWRANLVEQDVGQGAQRESSRPACRIDSFPDVRA
jgi:hypothetical protein